MTPGDAETFKQAAALAQAGRKAEAHSILTELVKANPENTSVLLWLAFTTNDLAIVRKTLAKIDQLDPANASLASAKKWLAEQESQENSAISPNTSTSVKPFGGLPAGQTLNYTENYKPDSQSEQSFNHDDPLHAGPPPENQTSQTPLYQPEVQKSNPLLIIAMSLAGVVVLVAVVVIVIMVLIGPSTTKEAQISGLGLPVYSGATKVELTKSERDLILKQSGIGTQSYIQNIDFEVYTVKGSDKEIALNYYNVELQKAGWTTFPQRPSNDFGENGYLKTNKTIFLYYALGHFFQADPNYAAINSKVGADDIVLMVMLADIDNSKLPPRN